MKRCKICGALKRLEDFPKNQRTYHRTECRLCYNQIQRLKMKHRNNLKKALNRNQG